MPETIKCDNRGLVFEGDRTDEEVNEEYKRNFGEELKKDFKTNQDYAVLCDECYNKVMIANGKTP